MFSAIGCGGHGSEDGMSGGACSPGEKVVASTKIEFRSELAPVRSRFTERSPLETHRTGKPRSVTSSLLFASVARSRCTRDRVTVTGQVGS